MTKHMPFALNMPNRIYTLYIWAAILVMIPCRLMAQDSGQIKVAGVVTDKETGDPMTGVSVAIMEHGKVKSGVATDMDGKFSLEAPSGDFEISFSYVGYVSQVIKPGHKDLSNLRIILSEDEAMLNDVVVNGFFTRGKSTFTGSVTQISGDELKAVTGVNIITAIAALTPGLNIQVNNSQGSNPNYVPELVMRGMSSFSNDGQDVNQPTIILDGTEISMSDLYDLDMNEVDQITVLKDASATALYGSKAANGVIVITRKPIPESQLRITYNFTGDLQFPLLGSYNMLNAYDKLEYERLAGLYDAGGSTTSGIPDQWELDELYNERYKAIMAGQNSDWLSQPARTSFSQDHSLRLYGGASNLRYELTARYANTNGVMKDDYRRRYSMGFKLDYYINNKITISNRTTYTEIKVKDSPYGSFSDYTAMNPYDKIYNDDGTINTDLSWDLDNPLYEATLGSYSTEGTNTFSNSTDFRWDINKMWRITGHFNIESATGWEEEFVSPESLTFKDETDLTEKGSLDLTDSKSNSYSANIVATFTDMFRDESLVTVSAGWEVNHSKSESKSTQVIGFFNDNLSFISNAAGYSSTATPDGDQSETADVGLFLSGNYSYRNRYFVDATWRLTGSSLYGENNRYGNFWSAGLGWNILNEKWMKSKKDKHTFDILKLRGSVGETGKVSFSAYQAMTMYQYLNTYEYKNGIGAVPLTIGNVNLSWEKTLTWDFGIDISMFNRRVNLVFDTYIKRTTDLLLSRSLAPSTGVTTAMDNLGEMENRGIEFQLDAYIFRSGKFFWKMGTTGYHNSNKITKISQALEEINKLNEENQDDASDPLPQYAEGESVTALKLVRSAGIDPATGQEVYIKLNGEYTFEYDSADKVVIGDTEPRYTGTFTNTLYWKGFSIYALFDFQLGAWLYNTTRATQVEGADPMQNADQRVFDQRWKEPGDVALYKDIADTSTPKQTDRFAEKEHTLELSTLNISYEFDDKICKKLSLRTLRIGVNFTDLFRLSTVKRERGTDYLYSQGFEFSLSASF